MTLIGKLDFNGDASPCSTASSAFFGDALSQLSSERSQLSQVPSFNQLKLSSDALRLREVQSRSSRHSNSRSATPLCRVGSAVLGSPSSSSASSVAVISEDLVHAFEAFDKRGDGFLTRGEFFSLLRVDLGWQMCDVATDPISRHRHAEFLAKQFEAADSSGSMRLSLHDFCEYYTRTRSMLQAMRGIAVLKNAKA